MVFTEIGENHLFSPRVFACFFIKKPLKTTKTGRAGRFPALNQPEIPAFGRNHPKTPFWDLPDPSCGGVLWTPPEGCAEALISPYVA